MQIPVAIQKILQTLHVHGYSAHLVGGCVRDHFLSRTQYDFDIATSATPSEMMRLFHKTVPTGIKHGTVTVIEDGTSCEITTYRVDGAYDGRRPENVTFATSIHTDLERRDFTMNAIAFDGSHFIDPFGGIKDVKQKLIRAVGDPDLRFTEDALRILRAIRFSAQLGFMIEQNTAISIKNHASKILQISAERIRDELKKIILSERPNYGIELLKKLHLLPYIFPELQSNSEEQFIDTLELLECTTKNLALRLCSLLYYVYEPETVLHRLKFERKLITTVVKILQYRHFKVNAITTSQLKKFMSEIGIEHSLLFIDWIQSFAKNDPIKISVYENTKQEMMQIINAKEPIIIKDLAINGNDIIQLGVHEGKSIGKILEDLLALVIEQPEMNQKDRLLELVKQRYLLVQKLEEDKNGESNSTT